MIPKIRSKSFAAVLKSLPPMLDDDRLRAIVEDVRSTDPPSENLRRDMLAARTYAAIFARPGQAILTRWDAENTIDRVLSLAREAGIIL